MAYRFAQEIGYLLTPKSSLYPGYTEVIASSLLELERYEEAETFYAALEQVEEFKLAALLGQVQALSDQQRYADALSVLDEAEVFGFIVPEHHTAESPSRLWVLQCHSS